MGGQVEETNHCCQNNGRIVISRYIKKKFRRKEQTNPNESTALSTHAEIEVLAWLADSATMRQLDMFVHLYARIRRTKDGLRGGNL